MGPLSPVDPEDRPEARLGVSRELKRHSWLRRRPCGPTEAAPTVERCDSAVVTRLGGSPGSGMGENAAIWLFDSARPSGIEKTVASRTAHGLLAPGKLRE